MSSVEGPFAVKYRGVQQPDLHSPECIFAVILLAIPVRIFHRRVAGAVFVERGVGRV